MSPIHPLSNDGLNCFFPNLPCPDNVYPKNAISNAEYGLMGQIPVSRRVHNYILTQHIDLQLCPGSAMAECIFLMKNNILSFVVQG